MDRCSCPEGFDGGRGWSPECPVHKHERDHLPPPRDDAADAQRWRDLVQALDELGAEVHEPADVLGLWEDADDIARWAVHDG